MKKTMCIAMMMTGVLLGQARSGAKAVAINPNTGAVEMAREVERIEARKLTSSVPSEGTVRLVLNNVSAEFVSVMTQGPLVKNAPYAAEAVTETTQRLFDGNQIVRKSAAKQYRDSEGRERREESMGAILITDPVAKLRITLNPETKTAQQQGLAGGAGWVVLSSKDGSTQVAAGGRGGVVSEAGLRVAKGRSGGPANQALTAVRVVAGDLKEENLGTRTMEGVQATGTRSTRTIPAGEIGNARPIEVVEEWWYSPDLQMTVMTRHSDPREGETVFRLTGIQRIEQVRSLFEVPSDYTVGTTGARGALKSKSK